MKRSLSNWRQSDPSGLVRLTLASTLQRLPVSSRGELAQALAGRAEDAQDHNLPAMVWYGITPLAEFDPEALIVVARATKWKNLRSWIARSLTDQAKERPEGLQALLSLMMEQPGKSDSLLIGMEEAFRGIKKVEAPENWSRLRSKLGKRPGGSQAERLFSGMEASWMTLPIWPRMRERIHRSVGEPCRHSLMLRPRAWKNSAWI